MPVFVRLLPTALKTLSATGSIMNFISSFTDTTGLKSPQSTWACGWFAAGAGGAGVEDEQDDASRPSVRVATRAVVESNAVTCRFIGRWSPSRVGALGRRANPSRVPDLTDGKKAGRG